MFALAITFTGTSYAQDREGAFELYLSPKYIDSKTLNGQGGSQVDLNDTWGWGFGFGYNMDEHWAFNFDIAWSSPSYDATTVDNSNAKSNYSSNLDTSSTIFTGIYNFSQKRFSPFVSGSFGWVFLDSNIPSGPPQNTCWWDYYWGYVCSTYLPTKTETDFTYGLGVGVRFDMTKDFFLRAAYDKNWIDFDQASSEDFDAIKIDIGMMFR